MTLLHGPSVWRVRTSAQVIFGDRVAFTYVPTTPRVMYLWFSALVVLVDIRAQVRDRWTAPAPPHPREARLPRPADANDDNMSRPWAGQGCIISCAGNIGKTSPDEGYFQLAFCLSWAGLQLHCENATIEKQRFPCTPGGRLSGWRLEVTEFLAIHDLAK